MASRGTLPRDLRVDMGDLGTLCLEMDLTDEMRQVAREELREEDDAVPAALVAVRARLQEEKDLTLPLEDEFLTPALRCCHWYPDSASVKLKEFYAYKARYPQVGHPLPVDRVMPVVSSGVVCILPRRDQHGRRLLLLQTGRKWDHKKISTDELLCAGLMCLEMALVEPNTQVAGCVLLWDVDGLSLSHVLKFTPTFAKMLLQLLQDCVPLRIKAIHFLNQPKVFDIAFNVFKPFINSKLRARLYFHGKDMSSLADHVDPKALPKQYGGAHELRLDPEEYVTALKQFDKYFEELSQFGYTKPPK